MRLAISNMAWQPQQRPAALDILALHGVKGLEIAPGLAFPEEAEPFAPSSAGVSAFRTDLERADLNLVSMQSLLFGVPDARLFGEADQRERFEGGLVRAIELAGRLGVPNLVLGSPANRVIPASLGRKEAELIAIDVLRRLGDRCLLVGTKLAVEPNAAAYGTNFLNTIDETLAFVQRVAHPAVSINFDIGALHMNGEMAAGGALFARAQALVSHIHISEPNLAPVPQDAQQLETLARSILALGYGGWFSIEMRAVGELATVETAIKTVRRVLSAAERRDA